jgi:hypothetical protein
MSVEQVIKMHGGFVYHPYVDDCFYFFFGKSVINKHGDKSVKIVRNRY